MSILLGIDVGGTGIKGAPVDLETGSFVTDRLRIPTPAGSTPEAVSEVFAEIVDHFSEYLDDNPIGIAVPGPVRHGVVPTMANLHKSWTGLAAEKFFSEKLAHEVKLVNDADAAGLAEVVFGAAKGNKGLVFVATLGTGIGSALIYDGVLIPNAELGHLEIDGYDAEKRAASSAKEREGLSYKKWAKRLQRYFSHVEMLLSPDLFVVGGGISKKSAKFLPLLDLKTEIVPAEMLNQAGIVGAAFAAKSAVDHPDPLSQ